MKIILGRPAHNSGDDGLHESPAITDHWQKR